MNMMITTREWNRISDEYKSDNDGRRSMLYYSPSHGTCSIPVQLDDINGREYGKYNFHANGRTYAVYAYSMAEALRIIRSAGHNVSRITGLKREVPYSLREQAEVINGRIVYIVGNQYEISDKNGIEMVRFGDCGSDATPREIYAKHFSQELNCTDQYSRCEA